MAELEGRQWIGSEISKKYCKISAERLKFCGYGQQSKAHYKYMCFTIGFFFSMKNIFAKFINHATSAIFILKFYFLLPTLENVYFYIARLTPIRMSKV